MMTCIMVLITVVVTVLMVPKIYWTVLKGEVVVLEQQELEQLHEQQVWVVRHLHCSLVLLFLVGIAKTLPGFELPDPLEVLAAMYTVSSLLLVLVEGAIGERIQVVAEPSTGEEAELVTCLAQQKFHQKSQQVGKVNGRKHDQRHVHEPGPDRIRYQGRATKIVLQIPQG